MVTTRDAIRSKLGWIIRRWQSVPVQLKWISGLLTVLFYAVILIMPTPISGFYRPPDWEIARGLWFAILIWFLPLVLGCLAGGLPKQAQRRNRLANLLWGAFAGTAVGVCGLVLFLAWALSQVAGRM